MNWKLACIALFFCLPSHAQYTSYFTGNAVDVVVQPSQGVVLMGGATENDNAMRWFLQKANGGDVLVIRTSGADGYNDYLYTELGIPVNSVETLVLPSRSAATDDYVRTKLYHAEAIWIAGGDQATYNEYWKNTAVDSAINKLINVTHGVVGGTSAGMAILGQFYFYAGNGSISSATAMANPYNADVTIGNNDFIKNPVLDSLITDTHFDNPDRRGRLVVFMARIMQDNPGTMPKAIACEEYTAVCIDETGVGKVFGNYPVDNDIAYFINVNCENVVPGPEICQPGIPLEWNRGAKALKVYAVPGTQTGANTFNVQNFNAGTGGGWQNWSVSDENLGATASAAPVCSALSMQLLNFNVAKNAGSVLLKWQTSAERNTARFEIQRSINGIDFRTIATVNASGNSTSLKEYTFNDNNAMGLRVRYLFYRLQLVDRDGAVDHSPVRILLWNNDTRTVNVYPNPVPANSVANIYADKVFRNAQVIVYNAWGKEVHRGTMKDSFNQFPVNGFASGIYFVKIGATSGSFIIP